MIHMDSRLVNKLKNIVTSIEQHEHDVRELREQIKEYYDVAKVNGLNTRAIKEMIKLRAQSSEERCSYEEVRDAYAHALGIEMEPPLLTMMEGGKSGEFVARS